MECHCTCGLIRPCKVRLAVTPPTYARLRAMSPPMIEIVTLLMIGFSVFAAAILLVGYLFFLENMQKTQAGKSACAALLVSLSGLQLYHCAYLLFDLGDLFEHRSYVVLLLTAPSAFYFFSRELLLPDPDWSLRQWLHVTPTAMSFILPFDIVVPVAFVIGAGYSIWFVRIVHGMRRHVRRFRFEFFFFGFFAVLAILVLALFVLVPYLDAAVFYIAYANFTGIAFVLIVGTLIVFPELLGDITDIAQIAYAKTTLRDVDVEEKVQELERAMTTDGLYQNEALNLKMLAEAVGLSGHQLSELINTRFNVGFSRYVRERRIVQAKRLLREDPAASILSISMATGFRSQSNFYAAFREIAGVSPGQYRDAPD